MRLTPRNGGTGAVIAAARPAPELLERARQHREDVGDCPTEGRQVALWRATLPVSRRPLHPRYFVGQSDASYPAARCRAGRLLVSRAHTFWGLAGPSIGTTERRLLFVLQGTPVARHSSSRGCWICHPPSGPTPIDLREIEK